MELINQTYVKNKLQALADLKQVKSNVDYLTVTTLNDKEMYKLFAWAKNHQDHNLPDGKLPGPLKDWKFKGFQGWSNYNNNIKFAIRQEGIEQRSILMVSGELAHIAFADLSPVGKKRITRLDLAVSGWLTEPVTELAQLHKARLDHLYERWHAGDRSTDMPTKWLSGGRPNQFNLIASRKGGGDTLYLGSRQSNFYGRLYDKGAQSKIAESGLLWRYELQCNSGIATPMAEEIYKKAQSADGVGEKWAGLLRYVVGEFFRERGVNPNFDYKQQSLNIETSLTVTTDAKKLEWLRTQVRPTVIHLLSRNFGPEAFEALGLSDYVSLGQVIFLEDTANEKE